MINLKDLRENPDIFVEAAKRKRCSVDINQFLELDKEYRGLKQKVEELRASQNACNKELRELKGDDREAKIAEMKGFATELKKQEVVFKELEPKWHSMALLIPSPPAGEVPDGIDENDNVLVKEVGELPNFSFTPKDHAELGKELDILDIERGVKISGARQFFLKGDGLSLIHI